MPSLNFMIFIIIYLLELDFIADTDGLIDPVDADFPKNDEVEDFFSADTWNSVII